MRSLLVTVLLLAACDVDPPPAPAAPAKKAKAGRDYTILDGIFGGGWDGNCNWDGVATVLGDAPQATPADNYTTKPITYRITGWRFCQDAYVASNVAVNGPFPIYVAGTLTLDGLIHRNGCQNVANVSLCQQDGAAAANRGFLSNTANSEGTTGGGGCFGSMPGFGPVNPCAAATGASGAGNPGLPGNPPAAFLGCGGGGGSLCNSGTTGTGRGSPAKFAANYLGGGMGLGEILGVDGYAQYIAGSLVASCLATAGGGSASDGATLRSGGGGGAAWVVVHAANITGSGSIEAKGGPGWTYSPTVGSTCYGGGGGGGGGMVGLVIGGGTVPTIDVSGGPGGTGQTCNTGGCAGLSGGNGAAGSSGRFTLFDLR